MCRPGAARPTPRTSGRSPISWRGRRTGEKLEKLRSEIEAAGGQCVARGLDARKEEDVTAFLQEADARAPLEVVISNPGANVNFPLLDTSERVFFKVWEMACKAGFLTGREAARLMREHLQRLETGLRFAPDRTTAPDLGALFGPSA